MKAISTLVILRAMQQILRFGFWRCFQHINKISLDPVRQNILHLLFFIIFFYFNFLKESPIPKWPQLLEEPQGLECLVFFLQCLSYSCCFPRRFNLSWCVLEHLRVFSHRSHKWSYWHWTGKNRAYLRKKTPSVLRRPERQSLH